MYLSNNFASAYEELFSFYPIFYREVLEMRAILEAQGRALDDQLIEINQVIDNAYIDTCDEESIGRYEVFLHIVPDPNESIEERRRKVKTYFTGFGKISATKLKEMLFPYTGVTAEITFQPADANGNNLLSIVFPESSQVISTLDIIDLLSRRLPAHIWYGLTFHNSARHSLYYGDAPLFIEDATITASEEDITIVDYFVDEEDDVLSDELGNILID